MGTLATEKTTRVQLLEYLRPIMPPAPQTENTQKTRFQAHSKLIADPCTQLQQSTVISLLIAEAVLKLVVGGSAAAAATAGLTLMIETSISMSWADWSTRV